MNNIKNALACAMTAGAVTLAMATPVVSDVTMVQNGPGRLVTITYKLTEDAVVTLDIQTNATPNAATGWASIGGKAICNAQGAVWRKVTSVDADGNGNYTIKWRPDKSWTDEFGNGFKIADGCAKAVVTAWALDNTPNYMVVDISAGAQPNTQKYYPTEDFLPGGLLGNPAYRTSMLVMRKIMAKDVTWTMGSSELEAQQVNTGDRDAAREATHQVTLTNNYYIGVFEVTQGQWALVQANRPTPSGFTNAADRAMRPVEGVCYNEIRMAANNTSADSGAREWPETPFAGSFLDLLHTRTGIDFDLPSEAQWEFAARAGNGDTKWGDGSPMSNTPKDPSMDLLGRYERNGGKVQNGNNYSNPDAGCGVANGTAIVGTYNKNSWGLYDMAGNVWEWCLDKFQENITTLNGVVNTASGSERVVRGGSWAHRAGQCRPAFRNKNAAATRNNYYGFRVLCTAGLQ